VRLGDGVGRRTGDGLTGIEVGVEVEYGSAPGRGRGWVVVGDGHRAGEADVAVGGYEVAVVEGVADGVVTGLGHALDEGERSVLDGVHRLAVLVRVGRGRVGGGVISYRVRV